MTGTTVRPGPNQDVVAVLGLLDDARSLATAARPPGTNDLGGQARTASRSGVE
jgi:hypothetical protein